MSIETTPFLVTVLPMTVFFVGFYIIYYSYRLSSYLKKKNYKRWRYLNTLPKFGRGVDSIRSLRYIYSDLDNKDKNIKRIKDKIKFANKIMLLLFILILLRWWLF